LVVKNVSRLLALQNSLAFCRQCFVKGKAGRYPDRFWCFLGGGKCRVVLRWPSSGKAQPIHITKIQMFSLPKKTEKKFLKKIRFFLGKSKSNILSLRRDENETMKKSAPSAIFSC